ncbi:hypothetical protein FQA39_LY03875 [Lamprigera yunnana]|nr:hypothetical protein FQA39_LY03875 [Lamprigera yunnana]
MYTMLSTNGIPNDSVSACESAIGTAGIILASDTLNIIIIRGLENRYLKSRAGVLDELSPSPELEVEKKYVNGQLRRGRAVLTDGRLVKMVASTYKYELEADRKNRESRKKSKERVGEGTGNDEAKKKENKSDALTLPEDVQRELADTFSSDDSIQEPDYNPVEVESDNNTANASQRGSIEATLADQEEESEEIAQGKRIPNNNNKHFKIESRKMKEKRRTKTLE